MMFRRNAAQTPKRGRLASLTQKAFAALARDAQMVHLIISGIYEQAQRDNLQRTRADSQHQRSWEFRAVALQGGGKRECARRLRQIDRGQLTAANGLVP